MSISTHVLDISSGRPASGLAVTLSRRGPNGTWSVLGAGVTDADGRVGEISAGSLDAGVYRLSFATAAYFEAAAATAFYPEVSVVFTLQDPGGHLHVPLLLSPFGYSTYKGT